MKLSELLRDPVSAVCVSMWIKPKAVTYIAYSQVTKCFKREQVKGMGRSNPDIRLNTLLLKDLQTGDEFSILLGVAESGKFTVAIEANQARRASYIAMLVSMEADRPSSLLPASNPVPEMRIGRFLHQLRIAIVGNYRDDRADVIGN